ncbi:MAG: hypothetical protein QOJ02_174 [Acidobacteriota bacterium]|nr:hypothetical protein [Acidobacteriota bacterium]
MDFPIPVNNFSFYILGSVHSYQLFYIDVYVSGVYYGTFGAYGNGQPNVPIFYNQLSSISNITNIRIYYVGNTDYYGYSHDLYYDNFTFTPSFDVNITSGRVGGFLNGTTQNALLGADVPLQANIVPSNLTGGTYSWSVTGPNQQVSATNTGSSYTVR